MEKRKVFTIGSSAVMPSVAGSASAAASKIIADASKMTEGEVKVYTGGKKDGTTSFDQLPERLKKKIRKRYDHLAHKHPDLSEDEIMERIGKKMNLKLDMER